MCHTGEQTAPHEPSFRRRPINVVLCKGWIAAMQQTSEAIDPSALFPACNSNAAAFLLFTFCPT